MVSALTVGDMSHGAGIENVDIGVLIRGYYAKPGIEEFAYQRFALRLVELATNGLKGNSGSGTVNVLRVFTVSGVHAAQCSISSAPKNCKFAGVCPITSAPVPSFP
jgi:hypothetical protein